MCLKQLIDQHDKLREQLLLQINRDASRLCDLADTMAECATNVQGQGYSAFINARKDFMDEIDKFKDACGKLLLPHPKYTTQ